MRLALVLLSALHLGIGFPELAQAKPIEQEQAANPLPRIPLLTRQEIIDGYEAGVAAGATHMLIVWDRWDFDTSYNFIVYCLPDEDLDDLVEHYNASGFYKVSNVYAMDLDIYEQLNEKRWYSDYP